jgi:S-adenosylmethionine synthetase
MQKCLITGASGFLGRAVAERFRSEYDVIPMGLRGEGAGLVRVDLSDAEALARTLRSVQPDLVLHLAAHKDPDYCEDHPDEAFALNAAPVKVMRDVLPASTRIVLASTDYVFDGRTPPYKEEHARNPVNVYGKTKCSAEDFLADRANSAIVRFPVLVGAGRSLETSGFIWQILEPLRAGKEVVLDDVIVRWPIWINDVAEAMAFLVGKGAEGTYHLSGPTAGTRYGLTLAVGHHLGLPTGHLRPSNVIITRRAERPVDSGLDTSKIRALGFDRFTAFAAVVSDVASAYPSSRGEAEV